MAKILRKNQKRLERRIIAWNEIKDKVGYRRPGSMKK